MREMSKVAKTANPTLSAQAQHITPFALRLRERGGCKENAKSRTCSTRDANATVVGDRGTWLSSSAVASEGRCGVSCPPFAGFFSSLHSQGM